LAISSAQFIANLELIQRVLLNRALEHGEMVECRTWKGGMSAAMIEIGRLERGYYFFDSFEGLPPVKEIDGPSAKLWQQNNNAHNCHCDLEDFKHDNVSGYKGWFSTPLRRVSPNPLPCSVSMCLTKF
jgi:O-methyltransferase